MMKSQKKMHVHLYEVIRGEYSPPLEDRLAEIAAMELDHRVRDLGFKIRVEDEIYSPSDHRPYWLMDFAKLRFDGGPGRASVKQPTRSFDLDSGEGFSEETAILYHPQSQHMIVQYNHIGPRSTAIAEYLSVFDPRRLTSYELRIKLRGDAMARLKSKKLFTRLEIKVAPSNLSPYFRENNVALCQALESQLNNFGGEVVTIEVGLDRGSKGSLKLGDWMNSIWRLAAEDRKAIKHLEVRGREGDYGNIDPIDLLAEKEELSYSGLEMDTGLRYFRTERYSRLENAFSHWLAKQVIP